MTATSIREFECRAFSDAIFAHHSRSFFLSPPILENDNVRGY